VHVAAPAAPSIFTQWITGDSQLETLLKTEWDKPEHVTLLTNGFAVGVPKHSFPITPVPLSHLSLSMFLLTQPGARSGSCMILMSISVNLHVADDSSFYSRLPHSKTDMTAIYNCV
jgi:hypothetical protein